MVRALWSINIEQGNGGKRKITAKNEMSFKKDTSWLMAKPSQVKFSIIVGLTEISINVIICRRWQRNVGEDGRLGHRGPNFL